MKNNKQPEIRFPGFIEDWEQRKLGEVFEQTSDIANPSSENLELWSLTVERGLTPKTARYNREFLVKKENQFKVVHNNEFIYNPMNMTLGAVDLNLLDKTVAVSGYYTTMVSKSGFDSKYFRIWLKTPIAIRNYKLYATGSLIERQRVQFPTLSQIKAYVPSFLEQQTIGAFFQQLDDTIALHQQELTTLKQIKQSFLQKMFPKEGEKVPEIRFPGFTDDWELRKLREVLKVNSGRDYKHLNQGSIPVYGTGGYMLSVDDKLSDIDGIGIGRKGTIDKPQYLKAPYWTVDTLFYMISFENNDLLFLLTLSQKINWKRMDESTGVPSLSKTVIENVIQYFPVYDEQLKIGKFFKQLDDTIALHQRELDLLKETKKAFLQKMFV